MNTAHTRHLASLLCVMTACGQPEQSDPPGRDMSSSVEEDMSSQTIRDQGEGPDQRITQDLATEEMGQESDMTSSTAHEVPASAAELFSYLQNRRYDTLPAEPAIHASTGPHGRVRTFVNPVLADSIEAQATAHPVGSASIKELYSSADELRGWAVSVKVTETQDQGKDWYWYEVFSTTSGDNPVVDGTGETGCTGCHSGGTDFILTLGPFTR